jgi:hypothetical protein
MGPHFFWSGCAKRFLLDFFLFFLISSQSGQSRFACFAKVRVRVRVAEITHGQVHFVVASISTTPMARIEIFSAEILSSFALGSIAKVAFVFVVAQGFVANTLQLTSQQIVFLL